MQSIDNARLFGQRPDHCGAVGQAGRLQPHGRHHEVPIGHVREHRTESGTFETL
jgi:hypothetical protein